MSQHFRPKILIQVGGAVAISSLVALVLGVAATSMAVVFFIVVGGMLLWVAARWPGSRWLLPSVVHVWLGACLGLAAVCGVAWARAAFRHQSSSFAAAIASPGTVVLAPLLLLMLLVFAAAVGRLVRSMYLRKARTTPVPPQV